MKRIINSNEVAEFIAGKILEKIKQGKKVLWFATGGSSTKAGIETAKIISEYPHRNLTVTLTDERYGPVGHPDSNWAKLTAGGFNLLEATVIPILTGENRSVTSQEFNIKLKEALKRADYKIGLFGVGADLHTAGILPGSPALDSNEFVSDYKSETFERITITPRVIRALDEAVVFAQGREKEPALEKIFSSSENHLSTKDAPAQILKEVPLLTVFYKEK
ncbi:MAG: 6-phosphogluconolactonase [Minisyncoccia bacterium]